MLNGTSDQVGRRISSHTKNSEVVGLGGAACEDDFVRIGAEECRGTFAGVFQNLAGAAASPMGAGWIAVGFGEERPHGLQHRREKRSRSIVVEVDSAHALASYKKPRQGLDAFSFGAGSYPYRFIVPVRA